MERFCNTNLSLTDDASHPNTILQFDMTQIPMQLCLVPAAGLRAALTAEADAVHRRQRRRLDACFDALGGGRISFKLMHCIVYLGLTGEWVSVLGCYVRHPDAIGTTPGPRADREPSRVRLSGVLGAFIVPLFLDGWLIIPTARWQPRLARMTIS